MLLHALSLLPGTRKKVPLGHCQRRRTHEDDLSLVPLRYTRLLRTYARLSRRSPVRIIFSLFVSRGGPLLWTHCRRARTLHLGHTASARVARHPSSPCAPRRRLAPMRAPSQAARVGEFSSRDKCGGGRGYGARSTVHAGVTRETSTLRSDHGRNLSDFPEIAGDAKDLHPLELGAALLRHGLSREKAQISLTIRRRDGDRTGPRRGALVAPSLPLSLSGESGEMYREAGRRGGEIEIRVLSPPRLPASL